MSWTPTKLRDFFKYFDPENPNHLEAVDMLQRDASPYNMCDSSSWVLKYRTPVDLPEANIAIEEATAIIQEFEGFSPSPYLCPAGVWTIGYGTTYYPDGKLVEPSDPNLTEKQASDLLSYYIKHAAIPALQKTIPTWDKMNSHQQAAIISFAYNVGSHFYGQPGFATITKALSSVPDFSGVPDALMLYVNPGSSFESGLRRRRAAEVELWKGKGPFIHG